VNDFITLIKRSDGLFITALKDKFQTIIDGMNMGSGGE